jgi:hypothetical protein
VKVPNLIGSSQWVLIMILIQLKKMLSTSKKSKNSSIQTLLKVMMNLIPKKRHPKWLYPNLPSRSKLMMPWNRLKSYSKKILLPWIILRRMSRLMRQLLRKVVSVLKTKILALI